MLLRESVAHCASCGETTPHCRRVVALPRLLAAALLLAAGLCFAKISGGWLPGGLLTFVALGTWLADRERCWNIACVRCRAQRLAEVRRTRPRLGSTTTIDPF